jgi:phosphoglycolate phosphatase-like HAD superfamily hydrolase
MQKNLFMSKRFIFCFACLILVSCRQQEKEREKKEDTTAKGGTTVIDPLPSWNDGISKSAIIDFVKKSTQEGSAGFVAPEERIACFDNDGTLWSEQPLYFQFIFALDRVKELAPQHPEWKTKEPFKSVLRGDLKTALAGGEKSLIQLLVATQTGMNTTAFESDVKEWMVTAEHPRFKRHYNELVYQPMVELLAYLRANAFKTYIVSGGEVEFMRAWTENAYGIPPEQVIGTTIKTVYEVKNDSPQIRRLAELKYLDDKEGKPISINQVIGRRPVFTAGNSDGDYEMLQWTSSSGRPSF